MEAEGYILCRAGPLSYLQLRELLDPRLLHAFSTRRGGVSGGGYASLNLHPLAGDEREAVAENRRRFCRALAISPGRLVGMRQVHGDRIRVLEQAPSRLPLADALITRRPGLVLAVSSADCLPVLIADLSQGIVAAVHAGWRGTMANILGKTLRCMARLGADPAQCLIGIGPCIGPCCYRVDERVIRVLRERLPDWGRFARSLGKGGWVLDLAAVNRRQAEKEGVSPANIHQVGLCTACEEELFFSYRRDGETGRMMSVIGLRE